MSRRKYRNNPDWTLYLLGAAGIGMVGWHFMAKKKREAEELEAELELEAAAADEAAANAAKANQFNAPTKVVRLANIDPRQLKVGPHLDRILTHRQRVGG